MSDASYYGQQGLTDGASPYNAMAFLVEQMLGKARFAVPVKIVAVYGGGVGPPPTVDVMPLVNQVDGIGNATPHATVFGVATLRNSSANGTVINDPVVGDIGHMVISDRDISSVLANNGAQANPGSYRRHDLADGVYHGSMSGSATPQQYVQFTATGVVIVDMNGNKIVTESGKISVTPGSGAMVYLGGDGTAGSFDFVVTNSGPSTNTKARFA